MSGGGAPHPTVSRRTTPWLALQLVLAGSLLALFALPLYALFTYATPGEIWSAAADPTVRAAIGLTLLASGICLIASVVFAIPLGYLLARRSFRGRSLIEALVALPVAVPHLLVGLGFFLLVLPGTPVGHLSRELGFPLYDSIWGVVVVMVFVSAPYTVLASDLAFRAVDARVLEASRALGAGPATAFLTVTFPTAARGIVAGLLLTWARAISEIGGILVIAATVYPAGPYTGPVSWVVSVLVYNLFTSGDIRGAAAVSSLFLLIAFAVFLTVRFGERAGWVPWRRGELGT